MTMMIPQKNTEVYIQSFKHDGSLHRTWSKGFVVDSNNDCFVIVTNKSWVIEADGRRWLTREPAVCFFWTNRWYNVISMIRKTGVYYYCNLASPSIYDEEAIKNIDYDLDVKLFPDRSYQILDENEYISHGEKMHYSDELKDVIEYQLNQLLSAMENKEDPFNESVILRYYDEYLKQKKSL